MNEFIVWGLAVSFTSMVVAGLVLGWRQAHEHQNRRRHQLGRWLRFHRGHGPD